MIFPGDKEREIATTTGRVDIQALVNDAWGTMVLTIGEGKKGRDIMFERLMFAFQLGQICGEFNAKKKK